MRFPKKRLLVYIFGNFTGPRWPKYPEHHNNVIFDEYIDIYLYAKKKLK